MFDADAFMTRLAAGPPLVMGVLNVTPDSFSDGGLNAAPETALTFATAMAVDGTDIIDIGAESTRPGGQPIDAAEEQRRLKPVLAPLAAAIGETAALSIDTYRAETAAMALQAGCHIVNDIWGLQRDPAMAAVVAEAGAPVICMHNREAIDPEIDILADALAFLERSLEVAAKAGVKESRIVLDPGFGFGKTYAQSLRLLQNLDALASLGRPLLIGLSRKGFIGHYSKAGAPMERTGGTLAANLLAALSGHAAILRVHDVRMHREALAFLGAYRGEPL